MERVSLTEAVSLSRIIYGMWRLAEDTNTSTSHVQAKIEANLDQGITTMDQADIYGDYESEALFGKTLKAAPHLKDKLEIISKCDIALVSDKYPGRRVKHYDTSSAYITAQVENSLTLMGIEALDVLLLHRPDPLMDPAETGRTLDMLVADGKIKSVGVSNFKPWDISLLQSRMGTPIIANQIEISLLAHEALTNGDLAFAQEHEIAPMAWSPLAGGGLFNGENANLDAALTQMAETHSATTTQIAIAWLLTHPACILPVMGSNNLERIAEFGGAADVRLSREDWYVLYQAALGNEVP